MSVQMKNLSYSATEIYKVKNCLSPNEIMKEVFIFQENEGYYLRSGTYPTNIHAAHFETDTITNLGPKLWKLVPVEIKNASSLLL